MMIINTVHIGDESHLTRVLPDTPKGNFAGFAVNNKLKRLCCLGCGAVVAAGKTALYKHLLVSTSKLQCRRTTGSRSCERPSACWKGSRGCLR